jgi:hypothetical protein
MRVLDALLRLDKMPQKVPIFFRACGAKRPAAL